MKIRIWHTTSHDNHTVTDIERVEPGVESLAKVETMVRDNGGMFIPEVDGFVPWHKINYFEQVEDGD